MSIVATKVFTLTVRLVWFSRAVEVSMGRKFPSSAYSY